MGRGIVSRRERALDGLSKRHRAAIERVMRDMGQEATKVIIEDFLAMSVEDRQVACEIPARDLEGRGIALDDTDDVTDADLQALESLRLELRAERN